MEREGRLKRGNRNFVWVFPRIPFPVQCSIYGNNRLWLVEYWRLCHYKDILKRHESVMGNNTGRGGGVSMDGDDGGYLTNICIGLWNFTRSHEFITLFNVLRVRTIEYKIANWLWLFFPTLWICSYCHWFQDWFRHWLTSGAYQSCPPPTLTC